MLLKKQKPEKAYRTRPGGANFITIDEIHIYEDKYGNSIVIQKDRLRERLYRPEEHKTILSEEEGFYDWQEEREMVLKLICSKFRFLADYIIFNAADNSSGKVMNCTEIMGDDVNSEMYRCIPWTLASLYYGNNQIL